MRKNKPITKSTWYDWFINYIPNPLKTVNGVKGKIMTFSWFWNFESFMIFFFYQGFLSRTPTTHRTAGEGRRPSYSTLPLPPTHENSDIYLQLYMWDDYHIFLIATLDEIYHLIELLFYWLMMQFWFLFVCLLNWF